MEQQKEKSRHYYKPFTMSQEEFASNNPAQFDRKKYKYLSDKEFHNRRPKA
jgi:hypothetical protein